ncbi:MAG: prephenate dehydratase [Alphaproteobacteria bacterium]|nr:prephenate dehydratase [Alphaproteobacteria bacterium]
MPKPKIAYQGEPGANSHIACVQTYPDHEPLPCATFEEAFQAVKSGKAALAMIPIENTLAGRVADVHHLMPESGLWIVGEHFLRIEFHLLLVPGAKLSDVKEVHSHVHALGQCRKAIKKHKLKPVVAADTAGAARELAESGDKTRAAIATRLAAETYGLKIAERNIEDEEHNTTRFLILSKKRADAKPHNGPVMTSFVFRVRNVPAALYKAMGGFATNGINMTKLESYQLEGQFNATQFYADVEGHPADRPLELALEELAFFTSYLRVLGTYPASPFRAELAKRRKG